MTEELFVPLVRLGFHGLALAMLVLGYRLLRQLLLSPETKTLQPKLKEVRVFLGISLVFFFSGASLELVRRAQRNEVTIAISPMPWPGEIPLPTLLADQSEELPLADKQHSVVELRHGATVFVHLESLADEIRKLQAQQEAFRQAEFWARQAALQNNATVKGPPGG